jgi:Sec-independent protein secretion pathway component TatC
MPSEYYTADGFDGAAAGPLGASVRRHLRLLLAVFLLVSAAVTALAATLDLTAVVPPPVLPARLSSRPRSALRLAVEVGTLAGAFAAAVVLVGSVGRDARVSLSRGRRQAVVAPVAFAVAAVCGWAALPHVVGVVASASGRPAVDAYWVAEVWLFFPVALGAAAATPFLLVAAARAGVVGRFTSTRQRGYAALAFVVFAACYSPPDGATFVLFAAPLFVGSAAGVAWLEFR